MTDHIKALSFTALVVLLVIGANAWYYLVEDSWFTGYPVDRDIIQLSDGLLLIGIGVVYLIAAFVGWVVRHGRAR